MKTLTPSQSLLVRMMNLYNDETFIEIIENFDSPEFWQELKPVEDMTDETCIQLSNRLASCYQGWNIS